MDSEYLPACQSSKIPSVNHSTNEILLQSNKNRSAYYLPTYVRFKVKEILNIDIEGLQGTVSGTLLFSFYYGDMSEIILRQFIDNEKKSIILQFGRQQALQLKQTKGIVLKCDEQKRMIQFVVRQDFVCNLKGDVFCTPFEIINLMLTITIQSVVLDPILNKGDRIDVKFNCMNSQDIVTISHSENCMIGNYVLARRFIDSSYKNSEKSPFQEIQFKYFDEPTKTATVVKSQIKSKPGQIHPKDNLLQENHQEKKPQQDVTNCSLVVKGGKQHKEKQIKIKNFQYAHFRIPLYKYPGASLVSIFLPLWIVGFINLLIFFQDNDLGGRIASIATLTMAFIAFIPTINEQIPQTPYIKLIEILIYMETIASVLCLMQSLMISGIPQDQFVFHWQTNGYYIISVLLNLANAITVFSLFIIHKCYWEKQYNLSRNEGKELTLHRQQWGNSDCDKYFKKWLKNGKVKPYKLQQNIREQDD